MAGKRTLYGVALVISIATFALYLPALDFGFENLDDHLYVLHNDRIRTLDLTFLKWSFTSFEKGYWLPLTWISYALDYQIWGLDPKGYHLHNIVLHCLNSVLVLLVSVVILKRYRDSRVGTLNDVDIHNDLLTAALTSVLFAFHPLRVESVVWVTERKDVLYAFFYLLSILLYLVSVRPKQSVRVVGLYAASCLAFLQSVMAKPMAVTLPAVLLLLDVVVLKTVSLRNGRSVLIWLKAKAPFLLISLLGGVLAILAHAVDHGSVGTTADGRMLHGIDRAAYSLWFYIQKIVFPVDLSPFYQFPQDASWLRIEMAVPLLFCCGLAASCVVAYRRGKDYWWGIWIYYLVTLFPAIGVVRLGYSDAADHHTYLPSIGPLMLVAAGAMVLARKAAEVLRIKHVQRTSFVTLLVFPVIALTSMTSGQMLIWTSSLSLANRAVEYSRGDSPIPYLERGGAWMLQGVPVQAFRDCDHAIELDHSCVQCLFCRAEAREDMGDLQGAVTDYNTILSYDPSNTDALNNRGLVCLRLGNEAAAKLDFTMRHKALSESR